MDEGISDASAGGALLAVRLALQVSKVEAFVDKVADSDLKSGPGRCFLFSFAYEDVELKNTSNPIASLLLVAMPFATRNKSTTATQFVETQIHCPSRRPYPRRLPLGKYIF